MAEIHAAAPHLGPHQVRIVMHTSGFLTIGMSWFTPQWSVISNCTGAAQLGDVGGFSLRSLKFHRVAAKTSIDEAETSGSELERQNSSETIGGKSGENHKNLVNGDMVKNSGERSFDEQGFKEAQTSSNRKGTFCNGDIPDEGNEIFYEENS